MKKSTVKHILIIGAFLLVVAAVAVVVYLLTYTDLFGHEDYFYGTDVMMCGSYDPSIDGYRVEKFESYDSFKGSRWKDREEIAPKKYGEDFFAENNLVILSFNYESDTAQFFLIDVVGDRESQEFRFVCLKNSYGRDDRMASYFTCFVTKEPLAAEYTFRITETYERTLDAVFDQVSVFQNDNVHSNDPTEIYHIDSLEAVDRFVAEDPVLEPQYRLPNRLRLALGTDEENDVWVVRASFCDTYESAGAYMEGDELVIWSIEDWHLKNVMLETAKVMKEPIRRSVRFFTVTLPKGESIRSVRTVKYREFDDPAPHFERGTYALVRDESSTVIKYNTEEAQA